MGRASARFLAHATATLLAAAAALVVASRIASFELSLGNLVLRSQRGASWPFPATSTGATGQPGQPRPEPATGADRRPRGVVLFVGDGMGIGLLSSASALLHGPGGGLAIERLPVAGLVRTAAADDLVTDSAASATAMATGFKAPNRAISRLEDGSEPATLFERARQLGLATGVVTTSGLVDATPAAFVAHAARRTQYAEILGDMLASGTDLLIGGDWSGYAKARRDRSYQEAVRDIDRLAAAAGYTVVRSEDELAAGDGRLLALFPPRPGAGDVHGPPLAVTALTAVELLGRNPAGFVALIESEVTDEAGHDNDVGRVVAGVRELDEAVRAVLTWAAQRGDVLVLVTADHDTGGLGIVEGELEEGRAKVRWASDGHTAQWVPVLATGPGAHRFAGVLDNAELGRMLAELIELPMVGSSSGID